MPETPDPSGFWHGTLGRLIPTRWKSPFPQDPAKQLPTCAALDRAGMDGTHARIAAPKRALRPKNAGLRVWSVPGNGPRRDRDGKRIRCDPVRLRNLRAATIVGALTSFKAKGPTR